MAHLLEWHRREDKSAWWDYFRLRELSVEELIEETRPLAGLEYVGEVGTEKQSTSQREVELYVRYGDDAYPAAKVVVTGRKMVLVPPSTHRGEHLTYPEDGRLHHTKPPAGAGLTTPL